MTGSLKRGEGDETEIERGYRETETEGHREGDRVERRKRDRGNRGGGRKKGERREVQERRPELGSAATLRVNRRECVGNWLFS